MDMLHLNRLEQSAYRTLVDDGVLDICLGIFFLSTGLAFATDIHVFGEVDLPPFLCLLIFPLWRVLRSRVVEPRVGFVKLRAARREQIKRSKRTVVFLHFAFVLSMWPLVTWDAAWSEQLRDMGTILAGFAFGLPVLIAAFLFQVRRWALYAGVVIVAAIIEYAAGGSFGAGWLVASGVILASGLFVLATFIHAYPVHSNLEGVDA